MRTLRYMDTLFYTDAPSTYAIRVWRDTQELSTALILYHELETNQGRDASGAKFHKWITIDAEDLLLSLLISEGNGVAVAAPLSLMQYYVCTQCALNKLCLTTVATARPCQHS